MAEVNGKFGLTAKATFGWFIARTIVGSMNPWTGSLAGIENLFPEKERLIRRALRRNRVLGRRVLLIIARYQKSFMDQSFLLGDEGGIFDHLCFSMASLVYAITLEKPHPEYLKVANALNLEAETRMRGKTDSSKLQQAWARVGLDLMNSQSSLYADLISDIEVSDIPLDPRFIDLFI